MLGDSLSAEYGLSQGTGWVTLLASRLKSQSLNATVINASISGDTSSGGKTRLWSLIEKYHPSIVIIELGGNDGLRGLSLAATESNFRSMISIAQKNKAKVLLIGMRLPPNYGHTYTEKFAGLYARLAQETGSALAPFLLEGIADNLQLFQPDRIHPIAAAHPRMLDNVWPHLRSLLK